MNTAIKEEYETGKVYNFKQKDGVKLKKDGTPKIIPYNSKKGDPHEVYPLKKIEDINAIKNYFRNKIAATEGEDNKQAVARHLLMFTIGINVGLRCGDLLDLTWGKVFNNDRTFVDGIRIQEDKTEKYKTFYLNKSAQDAITEYINEVNPLIEPDIHIFRSREGGSISVRRACQVLKEAAKSCGIKQNIGTHSMRKTWGYFQLKAHQGDVMFLTHLQRLLNHSSQLATLRYCGLEDEENKVYYNDINL